MTAPTLNESGNLRLEEFKAKLARWVARFSDDTDFSEVTEISDDSISFSVRPVDKAVPT